MAPELTRTGKATTRSDMFSFGALLLEVACGRKPVDLSMDERRVSLVGWVSELHSDGRLLHAADSKLRNEYDAGEMEKVLKLGLFCSDPNAERRLGIRQVCQILAGEAPFPDVHTASINVNVIGLSIVGVNGDADSTEPEFYAWPGAVFDPCSNEKQRHTFLLQHYLRFQHGPAPI